MPNLLASLKALNRKERFHLLHDALGFADQTFILGYAFRARLADCLELDIPHNAFVAMDYQLNWLERAVLGQYGQRNIQDVDLLVAFEREGVTHLILVEAKCDSEWDGRQLESKVTRLRELFAEAPPGVRGHFVLTSKHAPTEVEARDWPAWMRRNALEPHWIKLHVTDREAA